MVAKRFRASVVPTTEVLLLGQPKSKPNFRIFFVLPLQRFLQDDHCFYNRLNLLGVTQTVLFMVPEETQTSTSSTAVASASDTHCGSDDGSSSDVLDSGGQVSTDANTDVFCSAYYSHSCRARVEYRDYHRSRFQRHGTNTVYEVRQSCTQHS